MWFEGSETFSVLTTDGLITIFNTSYDERTLYIRIEITERRLMSHAC